MRSKIHALNISISKSIQNLQRQIDKQILHYGANKKQKHKQCVQIKKKEKYTKSKIHSDVKMNA